MSLDKKDFTSGAEAARLDTERLKKSVAELSGALAIMGREARQSGGGTDAMKEKIREARQELKGLQSDLRTAGAEYVALRGAAGQGDGLQLAGAKRVRKGLGGIEGAVLGGGDAFQVGQSAVQGAAMSLQLSLGPLLAVAAGLQLASKVHEAVEEAHKLKLELNDALTPLSDGNAAFVSVDALKTKLEELAKVVAEVRNVKPTIAGSLGSFGNDVAENTVKLFETGHYGTQDSAKEQFNSGTEADNERLRLAGELTEKQKTLNALKAEEFQFGKDQVDQNGKSVDQRERELELTEKIGAVLRIPSSAATRPRAGRRCKTSMTSTTCKRRSRPSRRARPSFTGRRPLGTCSTPIPGSSARTGRKTS